MLVETDFNILLFFVSNFEMRFIRGVAAGSFLIIVGGHSDDGDSDDGLPS